MNSLALPWDQKNKNKKKTDFCGEKKKIVCKFNDTCFIVLDWHCHGYLLVCAEVQRGCVFGLGWVNQSIYDWIICTVGAVSLYVNFKYIYKLQCFSKNTLCPVITDSRILKTRLRDTWWRSIVFPFPSHFASNSERMQTNCDGITARECKGCWKPKIVIPSCLTISHQLRHRLKGKI